MSTKTTHLTLDEARARGLVLRVGARQYALILRAKRSTYSMVYPGGYPEMRAVRRLVARGVLKPALGYPGVWELTEAGRLAWIVTA